MAKAQYHFKTHPEFPATYIAFQGARCLGLVKRFGIHNKWWWKPENWHVVCRTRENAAEFLATLEPFCEASR